MFSKLLRSWSVAGFVCTTLANEIKLQTGLIQYIKDILYERVANV